MKELSNSISSLPRNTKRAVAIITDIGLCFICTWLAFIIRLEEIILFKEFNVFSILISVLIAIPIFWLCGLYRIVFRFVGLSIIFTVFLSTVLYGLLYFLVIGAYGIQDVPRSIGILQPMLLFFAILSSRLGIKYLLHHNFIFTSYSNKKNILVYGAGQAGRQLVTALENSHEFNVVGFIDDNEHLHRQVVSGKIVYSEKNLRKLTHTKEISMIFLAMPKIGRSQRNQIIEKLNQHKLVVKTLPSISELVEGRIKISDIRDLNVEDLLSRDEVKPDINLLNRNINSKVICVTGAGGSIGSELCRQIVKLKPNKLILLELNEFALYQIYEELSALNKNLKIIPLLVNVQDQKKIETIFENFKVNTVYHAAAYKHVPLVEENICEGVKNNVFSTLAIANACLSKTIDNLVLISSDKAVRPTNVMGASKRIAELCMQGICNNDKNVKTHFSIVRFGNVLESSGSVIPKFKNQIKAGGPITLTHPDVTRYFMTVSEAAQLVLQAGSMGKYSEVFVLDMGQNIKIRELIYKMISLSGFTVKNKKNPSGDIEIKITGLRPGEKLFEELIIGDNPQKTCHDKIFKAHDPFIPFKQLKPDLDDLAFFVDENNIDEVLKIIRKLVPFYAPNSEIVDHLYSKKLNFKNETKINSIIKDTNNKIIMINTK